MTGVSAAERAVRRIVEPWYRGSKSRLRTASSIPFRAREGHGERLVHLDAKAHVEPDVSWRARRPDKPVVHLVEHEHAGRRFDECPP